MTRERIKSKTISRQSLVYSLTHIRTYINLVEFVVDPRTARAEDGSKRLIAIGYDGHCIAQNSLVQLWAHLVPVSAE